MSKPRACRSTLQLKKPTDTDPAALVRRATQKRLYKARLGLEALAFRLDVLHADKTGSARLCYGVPALELTYEADGGLQAIARTKREASEGCGLCAAWLEQTSDLRQRIAELLEKPLPDRDPSCTGFPLPLSVVRNMGKARPRKYLQDRPRRHVAELLAEQEERRAERKSRGAAFLADFQRELAEDAAAKAAASVPH